MQTLESLYLFCLPIFNNAKKGKAAQLQKEY